MSSHRFTRASTRRAAPYALRSAPQVSPAVRGMPFMCPMDFCGTVLHPSFAADGSVEYRCHVGRHGRVGAVVNGRIELQVRTAVSPRLRYLLDRPPCLEDGCKRPRNKTCGRSCCRKHCLKQNGPCGGYRHDYARALKELEERQLRERTPLFLPSPSPPPPPAPVAVVDNDPSKALVQLLFTDRDFTVETVCNVAYNMVDLASQTLRAREILHVHQIRPASLEYLDADGEWYRTAGRAIPVHDGQLYLRARSIGHARNFPPSYYADMAPRVQRFFGLLDRGFEADIAFATVFNCEATPSDHDSLKLCREVLEKSPRHLRDRFHAAGRTPQGTWSEFVHTYFDSPEARASPVRGSPSPSTPDSSPVMGHARRAALAASLPIAGPSRHRYQQNASPPPYVLSSDSE